MNLISTYIESPAQGLAHQDLCLDTMIIDLPFCSVRSHRPHHWTNEDIQSLNLIQHQYLAFNLDGIYTDHELSIIQSTINDRALDQLFNACRIQDPGLIVWLKQHYPHLHIQFNPETGIQNTPAIQTLHQHGIHRLILNHETPYSVIRDLPKKFPTLEFEVFVQGPILIQYSRRRFLSDLYDADPNIPIRVDAEDEELPERLFTFLNTSFGHFMFAQFHRSLAKYSDKLGQLDGCSWLIDSRGESTSYLNTCIDLYMNLDSYASDDISNKIHHLMSESKKPQKPGFFLSNNTDYDWRDESKTNHKQPMGRVLSKTKNDATLVEFYTPISSQTQVLCINPDQTEKEVALDEIKDLSLQPVSTIHPFTPYLLPNQQKGIQFKGQLYFNP